MIKPIIPIIIKPKSSLLLLILVPIELKKFENELESETEFELDLVKGSGVKFTVSGISKVDRKSTRLNSSH